MVEQRITRVALRQLRRHPRNSNVMPPAMLAKLRRHIERGGHYPPLIVRPMPGEDGAYQLLDGHHRRRVLAELGRSDADCVVWEADDNAALLLLATLNRLAGQDDPHQRATLVGELGERLKLDAAHLARLLPEASDQVSKLLSLRDPPPKPRPPPPLEQMPVAVHFFLLPPQKRRLDQALEAMGGGREEALMKMVERIERVLQD